MSLTDPATGITNAVATPRLPGTMRLGEVHLTVTELDRSLTFYVDALGLRLHRRTDVAAEVGDGERTLLVLVADADARPRRRTPGLYHVALLVPDRRELARMAERLVRTRTPMTGASDHFTHEAIYLNDPDGNGLELAADRPRAEWPDVSVVLSRIDPLNAPDLMATMTGEAPRLHVAAGLRIGHVHLSVGDLDVGLGYYRDALGLDLWGRMEGAAFLRAGAYHHHLGINTWMGARMELADTGAVGLRHWTMELPTAADVSEVADRLHAAGAPVKRDERGVTTEDPWGIVLRVAAADDEQRR